MLRHFPFGRGDPVSVGGVRAIYPQGRIAPSEKDRQAPWIALAPKLREGVTMSETRPVSDVPSAARGAFLQTWTAVVGGAMAALLPLASNVYAAGSDVIRVGLIGCGGRGTGAAEQALNADKNVKLVAMGDVFEDRLQ